MITSTISETKNHLSELLQRVRQGETLLILDRNRPVARMDAVPQGAENPHLLPAATHLHPSEVLNLPIGGVPGVGSGTLQALLEERDSGL